MHLRTPGCCDTDRIGGRAEVFRTLRRARAGGSGAWKGWNDSSATVAPVQNLEPISDEGASHTCRITFKTTVITQRRSLKMLSEHPTSKTKDDASYDPWRPSSKHVNDTKRRGASASRSALKLAFSAVEHGGPSSHHTRSRLKQHSTSAQPTPHS